MKSEEISIVKNDITDDSIYRIHSPIWHDGPYIATGAGHFMARSLYNVERNNLNMFLVMMTVNGQGLIDYHEKTFLLEPGTAVIINGMEYHHYRTAPGCKLWDFLWLRFAPQGMDGIEKLADSFNAFPISVHSPEVRALFEDFVAKVNAETIPEELQLSAIGAKIIAELMQSTVRDTTSVKNNRDNSRIFASMKRIRSEYNQPLSLECLAKECFMTRYSYIRSFSRLIGVTPYQYLQSVRMDRARQLLETSDESIGVIALAVGFHDQNNFSKQFLKQCGMTPSQYRRQFGVVVKKDDAVMQRN